MIELDHNWNTTFRMTILGYLLSIGLATAAYFLVELQSLKGPEIIGILVGLTVLLAIVQLVFFMHIGIESKPRWNLMIFIFTLLIIAILIGGSLWIMSNLDYNVMPTMQS